MGSVCHGESLAKRLAEIEVTYKMIQEYVEKKYGFKVHTAYIAEVKKVSGADHV